MTRLCSECENAAFTSSGVYCIALSEFIWDEKVAEDCGLYEGPEPEVEAPAEADILSFNGRSDFRGQAEARASSGLGALEGIRSLLGQRVEVYLGEDAGRQVIVMGRLLEVSDGGEFTVEDECGFVHYCWPMLAVMAAPE